MEEIEELRGAIEKVVSDLDGVSECSVRIIDYNKVNVGSVKAFSISVNGSNVSANFAVERVHEFLQRGISLKEIIADIPEQIEGCNDLNSKLHDSEFLKSHVICRLCNYEQNKNFLQDKVYRRVLDLAIYCTVIFENNKHCCTASCLDQAFFEGLGLDVEMLFEMAMKNSVELSPRSVLNIADVVPDVEESAPDDFSFRVMTVKGGCNGAIAMFYPDSLKQYAELYGIKTFCILPSSIHEVLLLESSDVEGCLDTVISINKEDFMQGKVLSDNCYVYDSDNNSLFSCATEEVFYF